MEPEELAGAIKRLTEWAEEQAPRPESAVRQRLREHLGGDPAERPIVSRALAGQDRPNFQVAVDAWCSGRDVEVVGLPVMQGYRAGLAEMVRGPEWLDSVELGAVEHVAIALGEHESVTCVQAGLWLVSDSEGAVVLSLRSEDRGMGESLALEVMAHERTRAERVLAEIGQLMRKSNVYRGRVLELRSRHFHDDDGAPLTVRALPSVPRERIVLPDGVLEQIERQAFGIRRPCRAVACQRPAFAPRPAALRAAGHGQDADRHVLDRGDVPGAPRCCSTGQSLGTVGASIDLATALQPSIVILEDVDLVAYGPVVGTDERDPVRTAQRDGRPRRDHDVLFVLTTNRADLSSPR